MSEIDWQSWARRVKLRGVSEKMALNELALLCDSTGSCIVSVDHLAQHTGRGRRQIFNILDRLESQGLIRREKRVNTKGRQQASRITLLKPNTAELADEVEPVDDNAMLGEAVTATDESGLRELMQTCINSGWAPLPAEMLVSTLASSGASLLQMITTQRLDSDASFEDTLSRAFELCKENARRIAEADYPWAMLKTIVFRHCSVLYKLDQANMELIAELEGIEYLAQPMEAPVDTKSKVEVETISAELMLKDVAKKFVARGVDETIVHAVHTILLEIAANYGYSRRHTKAATHPALSLLVPSAAVRRQWMSVVVGTRRYPWNGTPDEALQNKLIDKVAHYLTNEL